MTNDQPLDPWYVTGFVDGEGCFCLIINTENRRRQNGVISSYSYWVVDFSIHLRIDDREMLDKICDYFKAGRVNIMGQGRFVHFNVRDRIDLVNKVIPHFEKFPCRAKKQKDFLLWKEAILILERAKSRKQTLFSGQSLSPEEDAQLHLIKDQLASRLSGDKKIDYIVRRNKHQVGKIRTENIHVA